MTPTQIQVIKAGDRLLVADPKQTIPAKCAAGSVMNYAMINGECPIEAYNAVAAHNKALEIDGVVPDYAKGSIQDFVYIMTEATCIGLHYGKEPYRIQLTVGDKVRMEGKVYEITSRPNHNFGLKEVV